MRKILSTFFIFLTLTSCKGTVYSKHPRDWEVMDLFWFLVCTLAILWFIGQIMAIDWSKKKETPHMDKVINREKKKDEE